MLNLPGQRSCPWEGEREVPGQSGSISLEEWDLLNKKAGEHGEKLKDWCPLRELNGTV